LSASQQNVSDYKQKSRYQQEQMIIILLIFLVVLLAIYVCWK